MHSNVAAAVQNVRLYLVTLYLFKHAVGFCRFKYTISYMFLMHLIAHTTHRTISQIGKPCYRVVKYSHTYFTRYNTRCTLPVHICETLWLIKSNGYYIFRMQFYALYCWKFTSESSCANRLLGKRNSIAKNISKTYSMSKCRWKPNGNNRFFFFMVLRIFHMSPLPFGISFEWLVFLTEGLNLFFSRHR